MTYAYLWKDSVSDFTTTHARTKRSNVIPGGGPYPLTGADAVTNEVRVMSAF